MRVMFFLFAFTALSVLSAFSFVSPSSNALSSLSRHLSSLSSMESEIQQISLTDFTKGEAANDCTTVFSQWATTLTGCFASLSPTGQASGFTFPGIATLNGGNPTPSLQSACGGLPGWTGGSLGCFANATALASQMFPLCSVGTFQSLLNQFAVDEMKLRQWRAAGEIVCAIDQNSQCSPNFNSTISAVQSTVAAFQQNGFHGVFLSGVNIQNLCTGCWATVATILASNGLLTSENNIGVADWTVLMCMRDPSNGDYCFNRLGHLGVGLPGDQSNVTFICDYCFQRELAAIATISSGEIPIDALSELQNLCNTRTPSGIPCAQYFQSLASNNGNADFSANINVCLQDYYTGGSFSVSGSGVLFNPPSGCPASCAPIGNFYSSLDCCLSVLPGNVTSQLSSLYNQLTTGNPYVAMIFNDFQQSCGYSLFPMVSSASSCPAPTAKASVTLSFPNFLFSFYQSNSSWVSKAIIADLVLNVGVADSRVSIVSVTPLPGGGLSVTLVISVSYNAEANALVDRLTYLITGNQGAVINGGTVRSASVTTIPNSKYASIQMGSAPISAYGNPAQPTTIDSTQSSAQVTNKPNGANSIISMGRGMGGLMAIAMAIIAIGAATVL